MKNRLIIICIIISFFKANGQVGIEAQFGGSNFLGASINTKYTIPICNSCQHTISPSLGIGFLLPTWDAPTSIIHFGINYAYKRIGIGIEASRFTDNPFVSSAKTRDFVDVIFYPNLNYTFQFKSPLYISASAGLYLAYSKESKYNNSIDKLDFEGDVIPGVGFSIGYQL